MSTNTLTVGVPVAPHRARAVAKMAATAAVLTIAAGGLYSGAGALTRHYQAPTSHVSYADQATIDRTLRLAWHSPATAGDFRSAASISTPDVVSVVSVVK